MLENAWISAASKHAKDWWRPLIKKTGSSSHHGFFNQDENPRYFVNDFVEYSLNDSCIADLNLRNFQGWLILQWNAMIVWKKEKITSVHVNQHIIILTKAPCPKIKRPPLRSLNIFEVNNWPLVTNKGSQLQKTLDGSETQPTTS